MRPNHAMPSAAVPTRYTAAAAEDEARFDPSRHLALEPPAYVKMLPDGGNPKGTLVRFPVQISESADESGQLVQTLEGGEQVPFTGLAYSAPFRLMSDEGVQALRAVIEANEMHARPLPSRAAKALRGLGYRSQFIRDFNYCDQVLEHFSRIAGTRAPLALEFPTTCSLLETRLQLAVADRGERGSPRSGLAACCR